MVSRRLREIPLGRGRPGEMQQLPRSCSPQRSARGPAWMQPLPLLAAAPHGGPGPWPGTGQTAESWGLPRELPAACGS